MTLKTGVSISRVGAPGEWEADTNSPFTIDLSGAELEWSDGPKGLAGRQRLDRPRPRPAPAVLPAQEALVVHFRNKYSDSERTWRGTVYLLTVVSSQGGQTRLTSKPCHKTLYPFLKWTT